MEAKKNITELINVNGNSKTPKYKQIIYSIIEELKLGNIHRGDKLPSINALSERLYLARDTVEKAYSELKSRGIITSIPGKGNFIEVDDVNIKYKVFLLFNKLSAHKKTIYDSFVAALGNAATVDFYIYNNDYRSFESLILQHIDQYSYYVIMPHFYENYDDILSTLKKIPSERLIILDKKIEGINSDTAIVYQNYKKNIEDVLEQNKSIIKEYQRMVLVFPKDSYHPKSISDGFRQVAHTIKIEHVIIDSFIGFDMKERDLLIIVEENDLIEAIKLIRLYQYTVGQEIGILSYNETPIKEVLADGISVISTDFEAMGNTAAHFILKKGKRQVENPFKLIRRNSF